MFRHTVTDHSAVVIVDDTVTIQVCVFRHTRLCITFGREIRNIAFQCICITYFVEIFVFVCTFVDESVHHSHRITHFGNVAVLRVIVLVKFGCTQQRRLVFGQF